MADPASLSPACLVSQSGHRQTRRFAFRNLTLRSWDEQTLEAREILPQGYLPPLPWLLCVPAIQDPVNQQWVRRMKYGPWAVLSLRRPLYASERDWHRERLDKGLPGLVTTYVRDTIAAVSYLVERHDVARLRGQSRLAIVGECSGARIAWMAAALDDRIRAVALYEGLHNLQRCPGLEDHKLEPPSLRDRVPRADLMGLIPPRALCLFHNTADQWFGDDLHPGFYDIAKELERRYEDTGAHDRFWCDVFTMEADQSDMPAPHGFIPCRRLKPARDWLRKGLELGWW